MKYPNLEDQQPSEPEIYDNVIKNNKSHGIYLTGEGVNAYIEKNEIHENKKCGIKLMDYAKAEIVD